VIEGTANLPGKPGGLITAAMWGYREEQLTLWLGLDMTISIESEHQWLKRDSGLQEITLKVSRGD